LSVARQLPAKNWGTEYRETAGAIALADLHRLAAARTGIAVAGNDETLFSGALPRDVRHHSSNRNNKRGVDRELPSYPFFTRWFC
jgi:hypothetical protein